MGGIRMMQVVAREPFIRVDPELLYSEVDPKNKWSKEDPSVHFFVDISQTEFKKNPNQVFEVPATVFWQNLINFDRLIRYADAPEMQAVAESLAEDAVDKGVVVPPSGRRKTRRGKKQQ